VSGLLPDDELSTSSATELMVRLNTGAVSSVELVDHFLDRIARIDDAVHAYVVVDAEGARAAAKEADRRRSAGDEVGPLEGLPVTIKDCFTIAGLPVTAGLESRLDEPCSDDAPAVAALRRAGAVILGTTSTPTMLADIQTYNPIVGRTNNPWDATRSPGGSSGGSAAAIAAGMAPLALGSDLSGSIRVPAAWCGITGLKPSFGVISKRGHIPGRAGPYALPDVSVAGPMGRTVADLVLALDALAGPEQEMATAWRLELPPARALDARDLRIGVWRDDPACRVGSEVAAAFARLEGALRDDGCTLADVQPAGGLAPLLDPFAAATTGEITANYPLEEWAALVADVDPADPMAADFGARIHAQAHRLWVVHEAERQAVQATFAELFRSVDAIICPVTPGPAILHDTDRPGSERTFELDGVQRPYGDLTRWCAIGTVAAVPSAVVPIGVTDTGLPVAVQVIGPFLEDRTALSVAALVERLTAPAETPA
jgi:amidase